MPMTEEQEARLAKLEGALRAITDQVGGILDQVEQRNFEPWFRCTHSGLLYPPDYAKEYGRKYGIGLGPDVCSEALDTVYELPLPDWDPAQRRPEGVMHPLRVTRAQLDFILLPPGRRTELAILDIEDEGMEERCRVIRRKQVEKSPQLRMFMARMGGH